MCPSNRSVVSFSKLSCSAGPCPARLVVSLSPSGGSLTPLAHNLITFRADHRWSSNPCFPTATVPEEVLKMVNAFLPKTEAITQKAVLYGSE